MTVQGWFNSPAFATLPSDTQAHTRTLVQILAGKRRADRGDWPLWPKFAEAVCELDDSMQAPLDGQWEHWYNSVVRLVPKCIRLNWDEEAIKAAFHRGEL